jgi:hypothetical protein
MTLEVFATLACWKHAFSLTNTHAFGCFDIKLLSCRALDHYGWLITYTDAIHRRIVGINHVLN